MQMSLSLFLVVFAAFIEISLPGISKDSSLPLFSPSVNVRAWERREKEIERERGREKRERDEKEVAEREGAKSEPC